MDGRFAERNKKSTPRIEWRKLFAEVEAIAGGTFCPVKRRPPKGGEKERKRERKRERMEEDGENGWFRERSGGSGRRERGREERGAILAFYPFMNSRTTPTGLLRVMRLCKS